MRLYVFLGIVVGCGNDFGVSKQAICDGVLQGNEEFVDSPFDADEDGFFDGSNADCQEAYAAENLDCNDNEPEINPGAGEVECDLVDNDCDEATLDAEDLDGDGADSCEDCDDGDAEKLTGIGVDDDADGFDQCDDCDDTRTTVNPGAAESTCNGLDDDCNDLTEDGADADADGFTQCDECDDLDPYAYPGATEVCDNETDDNCDGQIDENCTTDYTGDWELDQTVRLSCAFGYVSISFDLLEITDQNPDIRVYGEGTNSQPGTMNGSFTSANTFEAENEIAGGCTEVYSVTGTFTTENTFEGTFTAEFVGSRSACADCTTTSWDIIGTRL
ncbi:MAG: MopE-related protein [Myxococcota bacterium]